MLVISDDKNPISWKNETKCAFYINILFTYWNISKINFLFDLPIGLCMYAYVFWYITFN